MCLLIFGREVDRDICHILRQILAAQMGTHGESGA